MLDKLFENEKYRKHRTKLLLTIDMILLIVSYLLAYWAKNEFKFTIINEFTIATITDLAVLIICTYALVFYVFKVYRSLWKFISIKEVGILTIANFIAMIIVMICTNALTRDLLFISIEFVAGVFALLLMFSFRVSYRLYRRYLINANKEDMVKTLIIGAGSAGTLLLREIYQNEKLNYNVVGFVDDNRKNMRVLGLDVLGTTEDLEFLKDKYEIEQVIVAISNITKKDLGRIVELAQETKLKVKVMGDPEQIVEGETTKSSNVHDVRIEDLLGRGEIKLDQKEISEYIQGKVVCVTGAGGSIGSELCRQIVKFKPNILVLIDINENGLYMLEQEFNRLKISGQIDEQIAIISNVVSIRERESLQHVFATYHPDVVYHAAAHKHVPLMETRPMEAVKNNVFGTHNVIETCIEYNVGRFIMISTDKAVNPTNVMGATKRMTEMILQAYAKKGHTKMAAVRFGNVLGSNGSVIPIFKKQIEEGGPVTITDKGITRYFMTIPEASQLVLQAGFYANEGEIFVLDMGDPVRIIDLAEKLIQLSGHEPHKDIEIREIGLRPGEKMFEELHLDDETFETTKNELIFKNHVLPIEEEHVNNILVELQDLISKKDVQNIEIREKMLEVIVG